MVCGEPIQNEFMEILIVTNFSFGNIFNTWLLLFWWRNSTFDDLEHFLIHVHSLPVRNFLKISSKMQVSHFWFQLSWFSWRQNLAFGELRHYLFLTKYLLITRYLQDSTLFQTLNSRRMGGGEFVGVSYNFETIFQKKHKWLATSSLLVQFVRFVST